MNPLTIDIGCGYRGDIHNPNLSFDILVEPFLNHANDEWITTLRDNGHVLMASAQDLPFRSNIASKQQIRAVMEHLPNPMKCLYDMKCTSRKDGIIEIVVPIITNHFKHYLRLMFIAFPYGVYEVYRCMSRMMQHYHDDGLAHISDVRPKDIIQYFPKHEVVPMYYRSKVFYGLSGKIFRFITRGSEPIHDIQGYYIIRVWK